MNEPGDARTDEQIYDDLKTYQQGGMIDYVLPTDPIGEEWVVGWQGQILKFGGKESIIGFLLGIQVCAMFVGHRFLDGVR